MSIFRIKEWVLHSPTQEEELDEAHLVTLHLALLQETVLVMANFEGLLKILRLGREREGPAVLLQHQFQGGIHQIKSYTHQNQTVPCLAVLLNQHLLFCDLLPDTSQRMHSLDSSGPVLLKLRQRQSISLKAASYNMVLVGEHAIVQTQDCRLLLIEVGSNQVVRQVQLNEVLPVLLSYSASNRSLLLYSSTYELMSLPFNNLFTSNDLLSFEWRMVLNSPGQQLSVQQNSITLLVDNYVYYVSLQGQLLYQTRLDYSAVACHPYSQDKLLVISQDGYLYIYKYSQLVWAAHCEYPFIWLSLVESENQKGLICGADSRGHVQVFYLGSESYSSLSTLSAPPPVDWPALQQEHSSLNEQIKQAESRLKQENTKENKQSLRIVQQWCQIGDQVQVFVDEPDRFHSNDGLVTAQIRLALSNQSDQPMTDLMLHLDLPTHLYILDEHPLIIPTLEPNTTPHSITFTLLCLRQWAPYCTSIPIQATFTHYHRPSFSDSTLTLPYSFYLTPISPDKTAIFKVTLCTSSDLPPVQELFKQLLDAWPQDATAQVEGNLYSFKQSNGVVCSLMLAKTKNKFRIQSSHFDGLFLLLSSVVTALEQAQVQIIYNDSLPFQDYFQALETHHALRLHYDALYTSLDKKTQQFRLIQKRLIQKFRETNSKGLQNMDALFLGCYKEVIVLSQQLQNIQEEHVRSSQSLLLANHMFILLLRLRFSLSEHEVALLKRVLLSSSMGNLQGESWEQEVYTHVTYLLRYQKDQATLLEEEEPLDLPKLKKVVTLLFDKLSKKQMMRL